jgi:hypothetical protein
MPIARPTILASARGELKTRAEPKRRFALDLGQARLAAAVGNVLAEQHEARIARHLVVEAGVQKVDHGLRRGVGGWMRFALE